MEGMLFIWGRSKQASLEIYSERGRSELHPRSLHCKPLVLHNAQFLIVSGPALNSVRNTSFYNRVSGPSLWDGVTGVSNAGKKRGRGKRVGRKRVTDLNRGQKLGTGAANILWPGLNSKVLANKTRLDMKKLPPNPNYQNELVKLREQMGRISHKGEPPLLRGWTGSWPAGKSAGPPDPVNKYEFTGFDSRILQLKTVSNVTGTLGKKYTITCFVVVGNKNGLAGFAQGRATTGKAAIRIAKNRAARNLLYIPRYKDHTVYHNIFSQYHRSKIMVHKKRKGYGLRCHRAIKTVCEQIGITDLHVKVEGSTKNIQTVVRGFFQALLSQETHQELADRMQLHVVETNPEHASRPAVVASPSLGEVRDTPVHNDCPYMDTQLNWLYFGDKHEYIKPEPKPFYWRTPGYRRKMTWLHINRNQYDAQMLRRAGLW